MVGERSDLAVYILHIRCLHITLLSSKSIVIVNGKVHILYEKEVPINKFKVFGNYYELKQT